MRSLELRGIDHNSGSSESESEYGLCCLSTHWPLTDPSSSIGGRIPHGPAGEASKLLPDRLNGKTYEPSAPAKPVRENREGEIEGDVVRLELKDEVEGKVLW